MQADFSKTALRGLLLLAVAALLAALQAGDADYQREVRLARAERQHAARLAEQQEGATADQLAARPDSPLCGMMVAGRFGTTHEGCLRDSFACISAALHEIDVPAVAERPATTRRPASLYFASRRTLKQRPAADSDVLIAAEAERPTESANATIVQIPQVGGRFAQRLRSELQMGWWCWCERCDRLERQGLALWRQRGGWSELMAESLRRAVERIRWAERISSGEQGPRL